jgi:hypothetical protein
MHLYETNNKIMEEQAQEAFMELMNWPAFAVATLVPMIIGFIWYNPKIPMGAA